MSLICISVINMMIPYHLPLRYTISLAILQYAIVKKYYSLLDPRLMIFFFYIMWYGILMLSNPNSDEFDFDTQASVFLYTSYFLSYFTLILGFNFTAYAVEPLKNRVFVIKSSSHKIILFLILCLALFFSIYFVNSVGSYIDFIIRAREVHFELSEGLGWLGFLNRITVFTLASIFGLYVFNNRINYLILFLVIFFCAFPLMTGKAPLIQVLIYMFAFKLFNAKVADSKIFILKFISIVFVLFFMSMSLRTEIYDLSELFIKTSSYNDTFFDAYNVVTSYSPGDIFTLTAPLDRIRFTFIDGNSDLRWTSGFSLGEILTLELYPEVFTVQHGTAEFGWEIENYLNFALYPGLFIVFAFGYFVGIIYKKACKCGPEWVFLNAFVFVNIFSILRGGVFSWYLLFLSGLAIFGFICIRFTMGTMISRNLTNLICCKS